MLNDLALIAWEGRLRKPAFLFLIMKNYDAHNADTVESLKIKGRAFYNKLPGWRSGFRCFKTALPISDVLTTYSLDG